MSKKQILQLCILTVLLIAILAAGIWFFMRDNQSQDEDPNESMSVPDSSHAEEPNESASADISDYTSDPLVHRYQFRLAVQREEELWDSDRYNYEFFPYEGRLLCLGIGEEYPLELVDVSTKEMVFGYTYEDLGLSDGNTFVGMYLDLSGTLWTLLRDGSKTYSVGQAGAGQAAEDRQVLSRYPLKSAPEQFAVWDNTAVIRGNVNEPTMSFSPRMLLCQQHSLLIESDVSIKEPLNKSTAAVGGSFSPQICCKSLKYTKYSCAFAPFCDEKSLATRSCRFNQSFLNLGRRNRAVS